MKTNKDHERVRGFTLPELVVVVSVVAILFFLFAPALITTGSRKSSRIRCVNNLKNIGLSFRIFATTHNDKFPMAIPTGANGARKQLENDSVLQHFLSLSNELSTPKILICPNDKRKEAQSWSGLSTANLSYFIGLNASESDPGSLLAGDRNLMTNGIAVKAGVVVISTNMVVGWTKEIHNEQGNIALGDGSVQLLSSSRMSDLLHTSGVATNRLAVP
jgi:prepilin-type N-terminal cleavage/methylation domain-containing protein/prepilin-type processing-associated H-X9-DG protein